MSISRFENSYNASKAVLAEYNRRLADMQQYIEETYARKQASIEKRLQALQQQFDMK